MDYRKHLGLHRGAVIVNLALKGPSRYLKAVYLESLSTYRNVYLSKFVNHDVTRLKFCLQLPLKGFSSAT